MDISIAEVPFGASAIEPGSFRDRTPRVFYSNGSVCRGLSATGLSQEWVAVLRHQTIPSYADYAGDYFEKALDARFHIRNRLTLTSGTRILYYPTPRETH